MESWSWLEKPKLRTATGYVDDKATREEVFEAINGECEYRDAPWNPDTTTSGGRHPVSSWVLYMEDYLAEARRQLSRQGEPRATEDALHTIRKIVTMGVRCMEQHGAPKW